MHDPTSTLCRGSLRARSTRTTRIDRSGIPEGGSLKARSNRLDRSIEDPRGLYEISRFSVRNRSNPRLRSVAAENFQAFYPGGIATGHHQLSFW